MKSYWFLFWAYNVIWLSIAGFMLMTFLRVRRVDHRLDALERAEKGKKGDRSI